MPPTDPRIDAYIAKAAPFAQPILTHLRALVRRALPDAEETIKWGMPHFTVRSKNVAGFAAFKAHCALVIHGDGRQGVPGGDSGGEGMGGYGRVVSLADLPPDAELEARIREAAERVVANGTALTTKAKSLPKAEIPMPDDVAAALAAEPRAKSAMDGLAPSHRREYLEWITGAKQAATRERRIVQAVEWLSAGKKRNWKHEGR